jgi:transcriptional regulator with XRE-family HTH domain
MRFATIRMLRYDYEQFRLALGKRVKELRKQRGLTHRAMVVEHGFHLTQIARIERGETIAMATLLRVAETFQVPVGELVGGIGEVDEADSQAKTAEPKKAKSTKLVRDAKASKK